MRVLVAKSNAFDWQRPAITELHALNKVSELGLNCLDTAYVGFPWATLFDCHAYNASRVPDLFNELAGLKNLASVYRRKITVCQHIGMLKYQGIFSDLGMTDVFWSHKTRGVDVFPSDSRIRIHAFPLFPVEYEKQHEDQDKIYLYSFVGTHKLDWYLTNIRELIVDILGNDPRGLIVARRSWHYQKCVYDDQIKGGFYCEETATDRNAAYLFRSSLNKSIFSLCPSGSGPNTIRLWESIVSGTIPVILADSYEPPGNYLLWEAAAFFCPETAEAVRALPSRLETMASDKQLIAHKRHALKRLAMLYGPNVFVSDIPKVALHAD